MLRCMNCGLCVQKVKRYATGELELLLQNILAQWLSLPELPDDNFVCVACVALLNNSTEEENPTRKLGHLNVCIGCGCSTLNKPRSRTIEEDSPFLDVFDPIPYHMKHQDYQACIACWMKGHRKLVQQVKKEVFLPVFADPLSILTENGASMDDGTCSDSLTEQRNSSVIQNNTPSEHIVLRQYKRAANTHRRCLYNKCKNKSRHLIPKFMKIMCLKKYNFYISKHARVCKEHILSNTWELLPTMSSASSVFNVDQVEDLISLAKTELSFDFEHVHEMADHICLYFTGYDVVGFTSLYNEHKHIFDQCGKKPKTSLALYLTRIRTRDTHSRIAKLFRMSRPGVENRMKKVKELIMEHNIKVNIPPPKKNTKPNQFDQP